MPRNSFEAKLTTSVMRACAQLGWRAYHTHRSDHSVAGFPDIVATHVERGTFYFELKLRDGGTVSDAQRAWVDDLNAGARAVGLLHPVAWVVYDDDVDALYAFLLTGDAWSLDGALASNAKIADARKTALLEQRRQDRARERAYRKSLGSTNR